MISAILLVRVLQGAHQSRGIRVGNIGAGKMGLSHFAIANALPDTAVVAVCDTSRYVVSLLKKYAGVQTFTHYQEMIDEAARRGDRRHPDLHPFRMRAVRRGAGRPSLRREAAHALAGREPCPVRARHSAATHLITELGIIFDPNQVREWAQD